MRAATSVSLTDFPSALTGGRIGKDSMFSRALSLLFSSRLFSRIRALSSFRDKGAWGKKLATRAESIRGDARRFSKKFARGEERALNFAERTRVCESLRRMETAIWNFCIRNFWMASEAFGFNSVLEAWLKWDMGLKFETLECNEIKNNSFYFTFILNNIDFAYRFSDLKYKITLKQRFT